MYGGAGNGMAISMTMMQARNDRRGKRAELPDEIARKLKSCSVLNCEDWRDLGSYTTYHCFPTGDKNQERWEIWTQLLRKAREDDSWIPFRGSLVCSHHFRPEDFISEPSSKRRKLIKNAIPSIFPTFTVDLTDPSYQLSEDGTDTPGNDNSSQDECIYGDPNSMLNMSGEEEYEYEFPTEDDEDDQETYRFAQVEDDGDEEDIQIINNVKLPSSMRTQINQGPLRNRVGNNSGSQSIVSTVGQVQVLSTSSVLLQQKKKPQGKMNLVQIPPNQVIHLSSNGGNTAALRQPVSVNTSARQQQRNGAVSSQLMNNYRPIQPKKSNRQQEVPKAIPINALPFTLNPDLEIEMVDPEEDLIASKNRIIELEQQNRNLTTMYENALEALKQKYESQLVRLRKRLIEQETLLNLHQISSGNNLSTAKKVRLS